MLQIYVPFYWEKYVLIKSKGKNSYITFVQDQIGKSIRCPAANFRNLTCKKCKRQDSWRFLNPSHICGVPRQGLQGSLSFFPYPMVLEQEVEIKHFITLPRVAHAPRPKTDHVVILEAIKEALALPLRYSLLIISHHISHF